MKKVIHVNFEDCKEFNQSRFNPVVPHQTDKYKLVLAYFLPGQFIPVHSPSVDVIFCIYKGKGEIVAGESSLPVKSGDVVVVTAGEKRGIKAETEMQVLHIVVPPPTDGDHSEVHTRLAEGRFK
ncbi:MAG: cupin [Candidatus Tectomicrobia bacterium]|uniref:Cupin n=1 Tax=Tectimicrobiota bacterium TaxID=2528274 RepID=A0A933GN15_UNCTE|nr:cupin [Candidatus Tectomicrobia bacterium]